MHRAGITGPQAHPRGLRHSFGVAAVTAGVPLPTIAAVLGHANLSTTAIYTTAISAEARELVARVWNRDRKTDSPRRVASPLVGLPGTARGDSSIRLCPSAAGGAGLAASAMTALRHTTEDPPYRARRSTEGHQRTQSDEEGTRTLPCLFQRSDWLKLRQLPTTTSTPPTSRRPTKHGSKTRSRADSKSRRRTRGGRRLHMGERAGRRQRGIDMRDGARSGSGFGRSVAIRVVQVRPRPNRERPRTQGMERPTGVMQQQRSARGAGIEAKFRDCQCHGRQVAPRRGAWIVRGRDRMCGDGDAQQPLARGSCCTSRCRPLQP